MVLGQLRAKQALQQFPDYMPALLLLLLWLATQVLSSVASLTTSTGIAWWAHIGGFVAGLVLISALRTPRIAK